MLQTCTPTELNAAEPSFSGQPDELKQPRYWYALYTRHHFEKSVDCELGKLGLQSYLPLRSILRQWSDRKKWIEEPLFSCYVFVYANATERLLSLQPNGVVRMLCTGGQPARIADREIEIVRRMLEGGYDPEPVQDVQPGDLLEIIGGPLLGLRGVLQEWRGQKRLIITFENIGRSVSVNIERDRVKKISAARESAVLRKARMSQPIFTSRY